MPDISEVESRRRQIVFAQVDALVGNLAAAGAVVGNVVPRAATRLSITFRRLKRVARRLDAVDLSLLSESDRLELERRKSWWTRSIAEKAPKKALESKTPEVSPDSVVRSI